MIDNNTIPAEQYSFKDFLFKNRRNRITLILAAAAIVIQFTVFKYFYPFASFIHGDSFSYLDAAYKNLSINTYMVGYSNFLRLFSVFTKSDTALVAFQYLLVQGSVLFFLFTVFYFYKPSRALQMILQCFMVLNPLLLHLANLVSSDCLFLSFSLIWFTLLLWIMHQASTKIILWHAGVLFFAFMLRYNALIYPFISTAVILFSRLSLKTRIGGIATGLLLCGSFVGFTTYKYKQLTGYWQYSPFSGWQWANNAMYAYRYVDSVDRKSVPERFHVLDKMIREYFDSTRDVRKYPHEAMLASTVYMWTPNLSLYKYRNKLFEKDSAASELRKWASMGPFYKEYGMWIIRQYPWHYTRYFLWPNANKYYAPPVEFLGSYNSLKDNVLPVAQAWFGYKSLNVRTRKKDLEVREINFYPILTGTINMIFLCCLLCFVILNGFRKNLMFCKAVLLSTTVWLINAGFTIFASSAALRFQSFPILLTTTFALLLVDWLWSIGVATKYENQQARQHRSIKDLSEGALT